MPSAGPSKAPKLAFTMAEISTTTTDDENELAVEINNEANDVVNGNSTTVPSVDRRFMNGDCKISTTAVEIPCEADLLCGKTQTNETCFAVTTIVQAPVGGGFCDVNIGVEFLGTAFRNPPNPNVTCFANIVLVLATEYPSSQPSTAPSSLPTLLASNKPSVVASDMPSLSVAPTITMSDPPSSKPSTSTKPTFGFSVEPSTSPSVSAAPTGLLSGVPTSTLSGKPSELLSETPTEPSTTSSTSEAPSSVPTSKKLGLGSVIGGGVNNKVLARNSVVSGGSNNTSNRGSEQTITGGAFNTIFSPGPGSTITGGNRNSITNNYEYSSIVGGTRTYSMYSVTHLSLFCLSTDIVFLIIFYFVYYYFQSDNTQVTQSKGLEQLLAQVKKILSLQRVNLEQFLEGGKIKSRRWVAQCVLVQIIRFLVTLLLLEAVIIIKLLVNIRLSLVEEGIRQKEKDQLC